MKKKNHRKKVDRKFPRRRRREGRKALLGAVLLLLFLALSAGIWILAAFLSPLFTMPAIPVERVRIEGGGPLDSMALLRKAGIGRNTDIMELDLPKARDELLGKEPYIESARITRNPAEGTIYISLRLRRPAAFVNAGGFLLAVDSGGFVIGGVEKVGFSDLPVITGIDAGAAEQGNVIEGDEIKTGLKILQYASESGFESLFPVSEINVSARRNIIVYAGEDGMQVRLTGENLEDKIREAAAIAAYLRQNEEQAEYIDLRFRRAIVKPR